MRGVNVVSVVARSCVDIVRAFSESRRFVRLASTAVVRLRSRDAAAIAQILCQVTRRVQIIFGAASTRAFRVPRLANFAFVIFSFLLIFFRYYASQHLYT